MTQSKEDIQRTFQNHKIIASESKSWYIGTPGTTQHSFSVTWSPGSILLYGQAGNVTLILPGKDGRIFKDGYANDEFFSASCKQFLDEGRIR